MYTDTTQKSHNAHTTDASGAQHTGRSHILRHILAAAALALVVALQSCSTRQQQLFVNDIQPNITMNIQDPRPIKLQSGDRVTIVVHSRDKEVADMFNMSQFNNGNVGGGGGGGNNGTRTGYTVDDNGKIEMPIIGDIYVRGLTRMELQNIVRYKLLASKLVRDPIVNVQFNDMYYYSLGKLSPNKHAIEKDYITLLEAIAECGDIPVSGRKENIMVLRTIEGQQTPFVVDVTKVADLYNSPVYYLQQNDIIYVHPDDTEIESRSFWAGYRTPTFWVSAFSAVASVVFFFTK